MDNSTNSDKADNEAAGRVQDWSQRVNLDGLVPYTHPSAAWSDRHSNMAITWQDSAAMGVGNLQTMIGWGGNTLATQTLSWSLTEDDKPLELRLSSRNFRPDKIVEVDAAEGLELTATASWPERNAVAVEFHLRNQTDRARALRIQFLHPGKGVAPDWKGPFPVGQFVSVEGEPEGSWSTVFAAHEHGRNVEWVKDFATGMTHGTTYELVCLAELHDRELRLAANGETRFTILTAFGRTRGVAREVRRLARERIARGWTPGDETARWREILAKAAPLPPKYRGQEKYERMYAHAISGLNGLFIRGEGGYTGLNRAFPGPQRAASPSRSSGTRRSAAPERASSTRPWPRRPSRASPTTRVRAAVFRAPWPTRTARAKARRPS